MITVQYLLLRLLGTPNELILVTSRREREGGGKREGKEVGKKRRKGGKWGREGEESEGDREGDYHNSS